MSYGEDDTSDKVSIFLKAVALIGVVVVLILIVLL